MRPKLADAGATSSGIEHRHRRLVAEHARRGLDCAQLELIEALEPPGRTLHPASKPRPVDLVELTLAARAGRRLRLQHLLAARQVLGQCADVATRLLAHLTGRPAAGASSLACTGNVASVSRSPSLRASCSSTSTATRSERFPKIISLSVCIATRSFSFSASSANTISVRADGSVGLGANRHDQTIHPRATGSAKSPPLSRQRPAASQALVKHASTPAHRAASRAASHSDAPRRRGSAAR